jgi:hypothetical protein
MGMMLRAGDRRWRESEGKTSRELPVRLEDGETVTMTWLRDGLGREFYERKAVITTSFAVDGRGKEVLRTYDAPGRRLRPGRFAPSA